MLKGADDAHVFVAILGNASKQSHDMTLPKVRDKKKQNGAD
jgi:hypothetical protein